MELWQGWAAGLCAVALAGAAMQGLVPNKGSGSVFRVLLTAFFLCALTAPLLSLRGIPQLDIAALPDTVHNELLEETVTRQLQAQVSAAVEEIVDSVLSGYGFTAKKVETHMDIADDGGIYIVDVRVELSGNAVGAAFLRRQLETRLGVPVTMTTEETT